MPFAPRFAKLVRPAALAALALTALAPATARADEEADLSVEPGGHPRGIIPIHRFTPMVNQSLPDLPTTCKLTYNGGPVLSEAQVVVVYWGAGVDANLQAYAPGFFQAVLKSTYMDWLQEYNTPTQTICRGSYVSATTITPLSATKTVQDSAIGPELVRQMGLGKIPAPTLDKAGKPKTLYFVYFPPGTSITMQGGSSCVQFCGYHSDGVYNGAFFPYAVIPDLGGACAGGCGAGTKNDNFGVVSSHELIEAITDVDVGDSDIGWYQQGSGACNGEIGDICAAASGDTATVAGYQVQLEWSNKQKKCVASGAGYTPCGGCTTNAQCAAPTPLCKTATGDCVTCIANTDCSGATPVCDTATNKCKACAGDTDCPGGHCATSGGNAGKCVACTTNAQCSNPKPVCDATAGTCGGCKADADCAGNSAGTTCNTSTGACGPAGGSSGSSGGTSGSSGGTSGGTSGSSGGTSGGTSGGSSGGADGGSGPNGDSPTSSDGTTTTSGCSANGSGTNGGPGGAALALVAGLALLARGRRKKA